MKWYYLDKVISYVTEDPSLLNYPTTTTIWWQRSYDYYYYHYIWGLIGVFPICKGHIKDTKRTRGRLDRSSSMQQTDYHVSSAHSMNARKCVHAQNPYSCQAYAHESNKVRRRGKKRGRETGKTEARRMMKRKAAQKKKLSEELKQGIPRHSSG